MPAPSPPAPRGLDDHDESVRIAACALDDMKKGRCSSPPLDPPDFVSRVTSLPLLNTALRAYEHGKASSRVVKYGAEMMESSVKNISRPVIDRLPLDVNQLDEFACRQLDKLERYRRTSTLDDRMQVDDLSPQYPDSADPPRDSVTDATSSSLAPSSQSRTPTPSGDQNANRQVVPRSRWQTVLLEAGGIGAAVSEESMRRLKYCLQWLQYATAHIDSQILILRDFIDSLQSYVLDPSVSDTYISPTHMRTLNDVRKDVVNTIRQVVDVVSKYAGTALPEPARVRVRGFILHLPQRWASAASNTAAPPTGSVAGASAGAPNTRRGLAGRRKEHGVGGPDRSLSATPVSSRSSSPLASSRTSMGRPTAGTATRAAQHILTLATESLDMMRGVTGVVKESLDRADAWVERLRIIGVQRQPAADEPLDSTISRPSLPGLSSAPSTPAQTDTPLSIPSTPAVYPSPDGLRMGIRLGEMSARTSLSELRLDGDGRDPEAFGTPKHGFRPLPDESGRGLEDNRNDMVVDDDT